MKQLDLGNNNILMKIWLNSDKNQESLKFFFEIFYKLPQAPGMQEFYKILISLGKKKFWRKYSPVLWRPVIGIMLQ